MSNILRSVFAVLAVAFIALGPTLSAYAQHGPSDHQQSCCPGPCCAGGGCC